MKIRALWLAMLCLSMLVACNGGGKKGSSLTDVSANPFEEDDTPVNIIEQAKPSIMVLPSDQLLERFNCLRRELVQGETVLNRDYARYLFANDDNKAIVSVIQSKFIDMGFPLTDLEQGLKSLNNQNIMDEADDFAKDAKTLLLTTISPDIVLEVDYSYASDAYSHNLNKRKLTYTINVIDIYTNKVISTHTQNNLEGNSMSSIMQKYFSKDFGKISDNIKESFANTIAKGREITVRISVKNGSDIRLSDETYMGDTYSDWIIDYMKAHTKKGAYKLQRNTDYELYFENVRIPTINRDGTQFNAYDWGRAFAKSIRNECNVSATNKSQGLGQVLISINGLR